MSLLRSLSPIFMALFLTQITGIRGVKIKNLSVPGAVSSNSESPILLDCDYELDESVDDGLVVKWFFNDLSTPIYQWIVGRKPTVLPNFKGFLDLEFKVTDDPEKMYRALRMVKLNKELTGDYRCEVSSSANEAAYSKTMIVYTPAKNLDLRHNVEGEELNVECVGSGVFPQPNINITTNERLKDFPSLPVRVESMVKEGLYEVEAKLQLSVKDLPEQITFNCILSLPNTNYTMQKSTFVYPKQDGSSGGWSKSPVLFTMLMSLIILMRL